MFIAEGFCKSKLARDSDFTTCKADFPLVVQFAGLLLIFIIMNSLSKRKIPFIFQMQLLLLADIVLEWI
jgi:hypothetical protein